MKLSETEKKFGEKLRHYSMSTQKAVFLTPTTSEEYMRLTDMIMQDKPEQEIIKAVQEMKNR